MYRTSTQEPRYRHSIYEREPRHVESKEVSEEYTSSSEEEEESSGKYTEESEETTESQESYSLQKRSEWSPALEQQWSYNKLEKSEKKNTNPYICNTKIHKQDKDTQKNLLSPFPSFLIPPIPRQVVEPPHYRYTAAPNFRTPKEEQNVLKNANKYSPKRNKNDREVEDELCVIRKNRDFKEQKMCQKTKAQKDEAYQSKVCSSDRVLKCLHRESPEESSRNFLKSTAERERISKLLTPISKYIRRPKSSTRENTNNQQTMTKFPDCTLEHEAKEKSKPKTAIGFTPSENDACIREAFLARNIGDGKLENKKGGELKEKLVYVVEEEGKEVTKLETDLFTLNEILAIKRDLLELSEFAKKLKKLKEMKKESGNIKNKDNKCQCKPAEELLKDVNRRIEILETRQEELEKGSNRNEQKGDTETESKNTNVTKTSSGLQSKTPVVQSSATTTAPSFPKTKPFVTRPEEFSNNSDIVKELVDIKTQLQRLEKRRISKEVSNEVVPEGSTKLTGNKNRAIAVFSSKTYIFTHENFDKEKLGEKTKKEEKGKNCITSAERNTNKSEQKKANVSSWLKNVKIQQTETDVSMFLSTERLKRKKKDLEGPKGNGNMKCRNCVQASKVKGSENQEPQKNRVLEKDERKGDNRFAKLLKNESSISEINRYVGYKKCVMSPSGRLFALTSEPNAKVLNVPSSCKLKPPLGTNPQRLPSRIISRSNSNGSIASAILAKQQVRKLKAQVTDKYCKDLILRPSHSKSLQELGLNSSFCKIENIALNMNVKNFGKSEALPVSRAKKKKEEKSEFAGHLEAHLMELKKNFEKHDPSGSSCTYSDFLASINLDSEETSATVESKALQKNNANNAIYTYMASTRTDLGIFDSQRRQGENCEESKKKKEKKKMQRKKEKKEKNKSELKEKSKPKKEKCKESTVQKKCKKKKKNKQHYSKCKNNNYSDFWKNYDTDDCFIYNEKKSTSDRFKIPNEDSLKIFMKRQTEGSKTNLDCEKSVDRSFAIRNVFKNLGRYYPKISNFHLFPFSRGEICDSKQEEHIKSSHSKTRITDESEEQENEDNYDEEDDENEDYNQTSDGSYALYSNKDSDQERHHFYHQMSKPGGLKNCKCVQVYLQTQEQRGWSGLGPFRALSVESMTNESVSRSTGSCTSRKSESLFPVQKSHIQCVGHTTQICEGKKPKCEKKPKRDKKPKCEKKHKRKTYNVCVCCKCGHSHELKKKKRKKHKCCHECPKKDKSETQECSDSEFLKNCSCCEKPPNENVPLLSFFTNFCKVKPRGSKNIAHKLSEVRYLKTCPRVKSNFFSKLRNRLPMSCDQKSRSKQDYCNCISRLEDIENKLKELEKKNSCNDRCRKKKEKKRERKEKKEREREKKKERKREREEERCRKKERERKEKQERKREKRKEKKKKKCHSSDSFETKYFSDSEECLCCKDEEKKKVTGRKEEEHKERKTKCRCPESRDDQKCTGAYYCTVEYLSSSITPEASTQKTTEGEKEEEKKKGFPRVTKSKELLEQTNTRPKLPFLSSFWEEIQNYKVTNSQNRIKNLMKIKSKKPMSLFEPGTVFLGDQSKEESRRERRRPNDFSKRANENKKLRKETNEKGKKEKPLKSKLKHGSQK